MSKRFEDLLRQTSPNLTRRDVLAAACGATATAFMPMFHANAAPLAYDLKPQKIAEGVWVLYGANEPISRKNGGAIANISILDTNEGAVIVDTGPSRKFGEALRALAGELTGKPIVRVLVTHFHPDHVFGNQAFDESMLAAPEGVVRGLKIAGEDFATAMYHLAGDWMRGTDLKLPSPIIESGHEDIGQRRLRYEVMAGHTDTDLAIIDESSGIMFGGDLVFLDRAPTTPHANVATWLSSLKSLQAMDVSKIVTGHGPVESSKRGILQTRDWLLAIEDIIRSAFDRGLSMTEVFAEPLPDWADKVALARYEFQRSVMHFYPRLEISEWPRVDE